MSVGKLRGMVLVGEGERDEGGRLNGRWGETGSVLGEVRVGGGQLKLTPRAPTGQCV